MPQFACSIVHGIAKLAITGRFPSSSKKGVLSFAEYVINNWFPTVSVTSSNLALSVPNHLKVSSVPVEDGLVTLAQEARLRRNRFLRLFPAACGAYTASILPAT